jgi:hypothetical protein
MATLNIVKNPQRENMRRRLKFDRIIDQKKSCESLLHNNMLESEELNSLRTSMERIDFELEQKKLQVQREQIESLLYSYEMKERKIFEPMITGEYNPTSSHLKGKKYVQLRTVDFSPNGNKTIPVVKTEEWVS